MIVITGASGHIGNCLVRELLKKGNENVRVIALPGEKCIAFNDMQPEIFRADIRDYEKVCEAFIGADKVFHLAGIISILPGKNKLIYDVNVKGTENVLRACVKNKVGKLVYTGSIHAYKEPEANGIIDELTSMDEKSIKGVYAKTKAIASKMVLSFNKYLSTVVCCPSGVIGPYDFSISKMGRIIIDYSESRFKICLDGSYNFVDVRDIVKGLISAMDKGGNGEVYNLGGEKITIRKIMQILENLTGIRQPGIYIPLKFIYPISIFSLIYYFMSKKEAILTPYSLHTLSAKYEFSYEKAKKEFGYSPMKIEKSIKDAYIWFKENKFIGRR